MRAGTEVSRPAEADWITWGTDSSQRPVYKCSITQVADYLSICTQSAPDTTPQPPSTCSYIRVSYHIDITFLNASAPSQLKCFAFPGCQQPHSQLWELPLQTESCTSPWNIRCHIACSEWLSDFIMFSDNNKTSVLLRKQICHPSNEWQLVQIPEYTCDSC